MHKRLRLGTFLATLTLGLTFFTVSATADGSGADSNDDPGEARVEEVTRSLVNADGGTHEVTVWLDSAAIAEDEALAAALPADLPAESDVSAAFAGLRYWAAEDLPVVIRYNDVLDPYYLDGSVAAEWAADRWNAVKQQSFAFEMGEPTTVKTTHVCGEDPPDGINSVRFSDLMPFGILAITCSFFEPQPGGRTRMQEFDIQFNTTIDWWVETPTPIFRFDLYTVMLHEFGHALGLGHSQQNTVMQPSLFDGQQVRDLTKDDIAGIRALYSVAASPTTSPSATATKTPSTTATSVGSPTATATPPPVSKPFKVFVIQAGKGRPGQ